MNRAARHSAFAAPWSWEGSQSKPIRGVWPAPMAPVTVAEMTATKPMVHTVRARRGQGVGRDMRSPFRVGVTTAVKHRLLTETGQEVPGFGYYCGSLPVGFGQKDDCAGPVRRFRARSQFARAAPG